jgi:hypothetical protein
MAAGEKTQRNTLAPLNARVACYVDLHLSISTEAAKESGHGRFTRLQFEEALLSGALVKRRVYKALTVYTAVVNRIRISLPAGTSSRCTMKLFAGLTAMLRRLWWSVTGPHAEE